MSDKVLVTLTMDRERHRTLIDEDDCGTCRLGQIVGIAFSAAYLLEDIVNCDWNGIGVRATFWPDAVQDHLQLDKLGKGGPPLAEFLANRVPAPEEGP